MKTRKPTIYQIKAGYIAYLERLTGRSFANGSFCHYFDRDTLKFFRQTMKSFKVYAVPGLPGVWRTVAKSWGGTSIAHWQDMGDGLFAMFPEP
jgi:hypothetical protein